MKKLTALILGLSAFVIVGARTARADTLEVCTVSEVAWNDDTANSCSSPYNICPTPNRFLHIQCNNGNYHFGFVGAPGTSTTCPPMSIDTLKMWQSLATAGELAGRPINIWWRSITCAGSTKRIITAINQK
jgi:hypothetical protein